LFVEHSQFDENNGRITKSTRLIYLLWTVCGWQNGKPSLKRITSCLGIVIPGSRILDVFLIPNSGIGKAQILGFRDWKKLYFQLKPAYIPWYLL